MKNLFSDRKHNRTIFIFGRGIEKIVSTWLGTGLQKRMQVYWATGFIKPRSVGCTYSMDAPLIMFQNRLFETMKFLLVITDFWAIQPKTLLNQHSINSKTPLYFVVFPVKLLCS